MLTLIGCGLTIAIGAYIIMCGRTGLKDEMDRRHPTKAPVHEVVEDNSEIGSVEK